MDPFNDILTPERRAEFRKLRDSLMRGLRWGPSPYSLGGWYVILGFYWFAISLSWNSYPGWVNPPSRFKGLHLYWGVNEDLYPGSLLWKNKKDWRFN